MMYAVYAVNKDGRTTIYNSSWLKVGEYGKNTIIVNPTLTLEDNAAGTFECVMPPNNQGYDKITNMATEIQICEVKFGQAGQARVEEEIWRGRVVSSNEDFMNNLNISCEGELTYLRDVLQPQRKYPRTMTPRQFFDAILKVHNSKGGKKKSFTLGTCEFLEWSESSASSDWDHDDGGSEDDMYRITQYEDTLTVIENALVDLDLPHLRVRLQNGTRYLDILQDERNGGTWGALRINDQSIRLGVNLLDCSKSYDSSDICSVIVPLGAQKEGDEAYLGPPVTLPSYPPIPGYSGMTLQTEDDEFPGLPMGLDDPFFTVYRLTVNPGTQYFITCRNWNGYGMYSFTDVNDNVLDAYFSTPASGHNGEPTDLIEEVVEVPEGARYLYISGTTDEIAIRVNSYLSEADAEQYVTVKDVVDNTSGRHKKKKGQVYVIDDELLSKYGWIEKVINFESITDPVILYNRALSYFDELYENLVLEVKAIDMNYLDNSVSPLRIGYAVPVISAYHGLDLEFPITKLEIKLDDPTQSNVTLGYSTQKTFTGISVGSSARINKSIKDTASMIGTTMDQMSNELQAAIDEASYLIKNGMTGYVNLVRDPEDNDVIREIVISEDPEYTKPNVGCWRWNLGGLGFSPTGYDEQNFRANVAIDMLGRINADRVTTGHMIADRIEGGTLRIGYLSGSGSSIVDSKIEGYSLINVGNGVYEKKKTTKLNETGLTVYGYLYDEGYYPMTGVSEDGEIKGYFRSSPDPDSQFTRVGTLNLARRLNNVWGVSLRSDFGNMILRADTDIMIRNDNGVIQIRSASDIEFYVENPYDHSLVSKIAYIDFNGVHSDLYDRGVVGNFIASGYKWTVRGGIITAKEPV